MEKIAADQLNLRHQLWEWVCVHINNLVRSVGETQSARRLLLLLFFLSLFANPPSIHPYFFIIQSFFFLKRQMPKERKQIETFDDCKSPDQQRYFCRGFHFGNEAIACCHQIQKKTKKKCKRLRRGISDEQSHKAETNLFFSLSLSLLVDKNKVKNNFSTFGALLPSDGAVRSAQHRSFKHLGATPIETTKKMYGPLISAFSFPQANFSAAHY